MSRKQQNNHNERSPLLRQSTDDEGGDDQKIDFSDDDKDNPRQWSRSRKLANVAIIALMAILSPLASSMFIPGMGQIADDLGVDETDVIGATTGFVVMLGLGPCVLAPLSETFGRRNLYLICFSLFSLLQIPTALSPNLATLLVCRTLAGFFGSVGIANGGGTLSDMFVPSERASIFGWYLLGPLMGPTLGPLFGALISEHLGWRWVFWILTIVCITNTTLGFFFLKETYAPIILAQRCKTKSAEDGREYTFAGQDNSPLATRLYKSIQRPLRILFTQPIVFIMALYQAIIFSTMYSLFTNMQDMYGNKPYNFSTTQVGLTYLGPTAGFLAAVLFLIPRIDTIFNKMTDENNGEAKPEFRLPISNVGAVLLPITLFWFGWTIEYRDHVHWFVSILATAFFGFGQVAIFNSVQNYYIDAFSKYAASAIAAGVAFRSIVGGVVPLFVPKMFDALGYGWGWSVFAFMTLALAPIPLLFMKFGEKIRKKFEVDLS